MKDTVYGSAFCPTCRQKLHAILRSPEGVIPPPSVTVTCQCQVPVIEVRLFYNAEATAERRHQITAKYFRDQGRTPEIYETAAERRKP